MTAQIDGVDRILDEWRRERPDLDASPIGVIGRLHRLGAVLQRQLDANFARFDLTAGEFDVLASLRRAGAPFARPAGELAANTMITGGGLTKRVDRLIARGLAEREVDDSDARGRTIRLTPQGVAVVDAALTAHVALEHSLVSRLPHDPDELATRLRSWLVALDADPHPPHAAAR